MGDHADEAIHDLLFGRGMWDDDDGHHYADTLSYHGVTSKKQAERVARRHLQQTMDPHTTRQPYIPGQPLYIQQYGRAQRFQSREHANDYFAEENLQPEFQQLVVTQLHGQTEKSYCVSGTVFFDVPYRGMKQFDFLADWIPKSQCILTGNTARIPQWLVRSQWQQREKRARTIDIKIPF